jgi:hypothetical protein
MAESPGSPPPREERGTAPSPRPSAGGRRDFLRGILKPTDLGSGLTGIFQTFREVVLGYRKLRQDVADAVETAGAFEDRPSELPRDMERRGEFWLRHLGETPAEYAWDPERLARDLSSEDAPTREAARLAAIRRGDASLCATLAPLLGSEHAAVRASVVEIMGSWKDPRTLPYLVPRLVGDPDPGTRLRAVLALRELEHEDAVEPLLKAAEDPEKTVRLWAGVALRNWLPRLGASALGRRVEAALSRLYTPPGDAGRGRSPGPPGELS